MLPIAAQGAVLAKVAFADTSRQRLLVPNFASIDKSATMPPVP
jgi:hypothetical protein